MNRACDEFLPCARFTPDQYGGISAGHHLNLSKHFLKSRVFTHNLTKGKTFFHLLVQIRLIEIPLISQPCDFFKSTRIGDCDGCLFGEDTDPGRILLTQTLATKQPENAEDFSLKH